jgi:phosphonate transport system ATP-binding protein
VCFELNHASAGYGGERVLADIDLEIYAGECVALMGRSGAGKSTLLNLLHAQAVDNIALVPQAAALVRPLSVFHNVYMGRLDRRSTRANLRTLLRPRLADIEEIGGILHDVELSDKIFSKAGELSGGQQQRTSVARALYNGRSILLADEPVSALDRVQGAGILRLLKSRHQTMVLVLHDVALALEHCDRIVVLDLGRKVLDKPSAALSPAALFGVFGGLT